MLLDCNATLMKRTLPSAGFARGNAGRRDEETLSIGHRERSRSTNNDDMTVEGTSVFRKAFSFAGGRRNEGLGQLVSRAARSLKRSRGARRGGGRSKSFVAAS